MLTKCIGIISYFPDNSLVREERIKRFKNLLSCLDKYFKLPIVIIAQNWKDFEIPIKYCNSIYVYKYNEGLGITKARYTLREKLLNYDYDYFIFLDDDSNIKCTEAGVNNYFQEIDNHPNMVGQFFFCWPRLLAISKEMLKIMDFEFIKDYEASRGEIWEDFAYIKTYKHLYPNKFFNFTKRNISEDSPVSKNDQFSTWYKKEFGRETQISQNTKKIYTQWIRVKENH